jgi:long-chain acyl-CoA synthetase
MAVAENVSELIHDCGNRFADRVALRESAREIKYGELVEQARALAAAWIDLGLPRGARVAVLLDNCIELVITEWACLVSGFVWVALNVRTSRDELERILDDSEPAVIVYGDRYQVLVSAATTAHRCARVAIGAAHSDFETLLALGRGALAVGRRLEPPGAEEPVRLRYTSGTAGKPKGAVLPRRCYDASISAVGRVIGPLRDTDALVHVAPMTHASGAMFLPHAAVGARAIVLPRFDVATLVDAIEGEQATAVFLVPTMLVRLVEETASAARLSSLRTIVYGGSSMPTDRLMRAIESFGPVLVQIYGLTESTWPVCALSREEHLRRIGEAEARWLERLHSCGQPTAVGELRIVADGRRDAAEREIGEIRVRGLNTMSGYWRGGASDAATDEKGLDREGWMHTGDLAFRDEEGFVTIVDRLHDMIVSGGFNVYPREVENALSSHPAVLESAVVGMPDREWGEIVCAAVVLRDGSVASPDELVAHCLERLAGYKKPRCLEIVHELPKNAAGKIVRRALRDRFR